MIKLSLGDWLYNAGVVGLVNILEHANKNSVTYDDDNARAVSFSINELENFDKKFFNYFIDTYEHTLAWSKVVSYKNQIEQFERENYTNFNEQSLKIFNVYIDDLKKYLKSHSHVSAYKLIDFKFPALDKEKEIKKVILKKNEKLENKIDEVKEMANKIKEVISFYSQPDSKKYIAGKNVIYTIIKNAWNGVSILNPQTKEDDIYKDYNNYFPEDAINYLLTDRKKSKFNCFVCDNKIDNLNTEMGFLNATGFDTSRKPSHVWNYDNDIAICPVCKLVYSCVPAGFTYVYNRGIFVNDNTSVERIVNISNKIKFEVLKSDNMNANTTYKSIITAIQEKENESFKYELADIQVVRYEDESYRFNILSKQILKVFRESEKELNRIIKASYKEADIYFQIYENLVKKLFNNENLFLLIHKLLIYKLSKPENVFYSVGNIKDVILVNLNYLKGVGYMDKEKDVLKSYSGAGYYLREAYKKKSSENKLDGISYKLLNALKTNNQGMFMDTLLNCYLYTDKQVPSFFTDCLKGKELFKTIGYAFVSGLIDGEEYVKKDNNESREV